MLFNPARLSLWLVALLACFSGDAAAETGSADPAPPAGAQPGDDRAQKTEALRQKGAALCEAGQREAGLAALRAAWEADKSAAIAGDLGACELKDGKPALAAEHLAYALGALPAGDDSEQRAAWKPLFDAARAKVGALKIRVSIDGADVFVGNRFVGTSPLPVDEVFVEPGEIAVWAKKPNLGEARTTVRVSPGGTASARLAVAKDERPPVDDGGPSVVPLFVLGGVGLAAGAVGVGLLFAGSDKGAEADARLSDLKAAHGPVPCPAAPGCGELSDLRSKHDQLINTGTGFLLAGGAALVGAVGYSVWAFGRNDAEERRRVVLLPVVEPAGGALWARGVF